MQVSCASLEWCKCVVKHVCAILDRVRSAHRYVPKSKDKAGWHRDSGRAVGDITGWGRQGSVGPWATRSRNGSRDRIRPLGRFLTPIPGLGSLNSATRSCTANSGRAAPSSSMWAAAGYTGEGELSPGSTAAPLNFGLDVSLPIPAHG